MCNVHYSGEYIHTYMCMYMCDGRSRARARFVTANFLLPGSLEYVISVRFAHVRTAPSPHQGHPRHRHISTLPPQNVVYDGIVIAIERRSMLAQTAQRQTQTRRRIRAHVPQPSQTNIVIHFVTGTGSHTHTHAHTDRILNIETRSFQPRRDVLLRHLPPKCLTLPV